MPERRRRRFVTILPRGRGARIRFALFVIVPLLAILIAWWIMIRMPGTSFEGPAPALTAAEADLRDRLSAHVHALAETIGPRPASRPASLAAARDTIEARFAALGYGPPRHVYRADSRDFANVVATRSGRDPNAAMVIVGAHYDAFQFTPGANDNASGCAALIELARAARRSAYRRTIRFVAFANEEPPWFGGDDMGSRHYAAACRQNGDRIDAMLSLESLGCYRTNSGSQRYPFPLSVCYPSEGNFVAFVGNVDSRALVHRAIAAFRETATIPSEGAALPGSLSGVDWSDHRSFWAEGWPAVMVTDTAVFRDTMYHKRGDTPDRLDYAAMARVVRGLETVLDRIAEADPTE